MNNGAISWNGQSTNAIDIGWLFDNSHVDSDVTGAIINLMGGEDVVNGQATAIDGHWSNATLNLEAGGAYSVTDGLADFGGQSATASAIKVFNTPGASYGIAASVAIDVAGSAAAPSFTLAAGEFQNGSITTDGASTLGQAGQVTTVGAVLDDDSTTVTIAGIVNAKSFSGKKNQLHLADSNSSFNVYGKATLTGTETVSGPGGSSVNFEGPVSVSGTTTLNETGSGLVLGGAVTGTGNLNITVGGGFYEQGGVNLAGNMTVQAASGATAASMQLTGPVTATQLSLSTNQRVDLAAAVTAAATSVQATGGIDVDATQTAAGNVSLQSSGPVNIDQQLQVPELTLTLNNDARATNRSSWLAVSSLTVNGGVLDNTGVLAVVGTNSTDALIHAVNGTQIVNDGEIIADHTELTAAATGPTSTLWNDADGQMLDPSNPATPTNTISIPLTNNGSISSAYIVDKAGPAQYSGINPADPDLVAAACDQGTDCGSGDYSTQQTDLSVAGWGDGLDLTRSYSSRLAASEALPGMFGYGWITPFEQRLYIDATSGATQVQTTTGSIASFTDNSGTFTPATGNLATLAPDPSHSGYYDYTQPDQSVTVFEPTVGSGGYWVPYSVTDAQKHTTTYSYNGLGQLTSVTVASSSATVPGRSITFTYQPGTNLVATATDPEGLQVSYSYDINGNLLSVTDSHGANVPENAPSGSSVQAWGFQYDGTASASSDSSDLHELTAITEPPNQSGSGAGNTTTIKYVGGFVTGVTQPGQTYGETWKYQPASLTGLNVVGETIQTTAPIQTSASGGSGAATEIFYNAQDEPVQTVYPDGTTVTNTYNSNGNGQLLSTEQVGTDGRTETTTYGYDSAGHTVCETSPMVTAGNAPGQNGKGESCPNSGTAPIPAQSWAYDTNGNLTIQASPSGKTTTYTYDGYNEPTSVTLSNPSVPGTPSEQTTNAYQPTGTGFEVPLSTTSPSPEHGTTSYSYDAYGDLTSETLPPASNSVGDQTTYGYDLDGRRICQTTPVVTAAAPGTGESGPEACTNDMTPSGLTDSWAAPANAQQSTYDLLGDVLKSTSANGNTISSVYYADQQLAQTTDPGGSVASTTTYSYLPDNALASRIIGAGDSSAVTESESYDPAGDLITQTDGNQTYSYLYTPMQQLASETDAVGDQTGYTYDSSGNLHTITYPPANGNANGNTTTYGYDANNERTSITYADGTPAVANSYTADGQLAVMSDATGQSSYSYDGLDRLTSVTAGGGTTAYTYDTDNQQATIQYPDGVTVAQQFYPDGQLNTVAVTAPAAQGSQQLGTSTFSYGWDGQLTQTQLPTASNETDSYTYNLDDALASIRMSTGATLDASLTYNRYQDDLIKSEAQTGLPGPGCDSYTYTGAQELSTDNPTSSGCATGATPNYAYDPSRNMTELDGSGVGSLAYNNASELCWTSNASSSNSCPLPPSGATTYAYNTLGERTAVTPPSGPANGYQYNQDENLIKATVPALGGGTATAGYTYNGNGQLTSSSGPSATTFTWDDTTSNPLLLEAISGGSTIDYVYGPAGAIEQITGGGKSSTVQYLHQDQIGSTRLITNVDGTVGGTYTYSPYGDLTTYAPGPSTSDTSLLGYSGQYTDPTTGLIYDQARWYDPSTGQFMVVDPKVETTWTPYAYADDDPLANADPTGMDPADEIPYGGGIDGTADDDPQSQAFLYYEVNAQEGNVVGETPGEAFAAAESMVGAGGAQFTSKTLLNADGYRIDVENPAPGSRAGQMHLQADGEKFMYNFETGEFEGVPRSLAKRLARDPSVIRAIARGYRYLGMARG